MAGNRSAAEDLRQRLEKWRQDREDAKQETKAAQKPIFAVRHTGKYPPVPSIQPLALHVYIESF